MAARAITRAHEGRGGIVIRSQALDGQDILFIRDEMVALQEKYLNLVRFTWAELAQIVAEQWSEERLRTVALAKDVMGGGRIVPADTEPLRPFRQPACVCAEPRHGDVLVEMVEQLELDA